MKVLLWTDGFWPRIGGIETQSLQFVRGMQERGHQYLVIAQKDVWMEQESEIYEGILIQRFDLHTIVPKRELHRLKLLEASLKKIVEEFNPDYVHLNSCIGWNVFVFLLMKSLFQVPVILTVHAPYFYGNEKNPFIEKVVAAADQICCVSNWVMEEMIRLVPSAKEKIRLVYNGLSEPTETPSPLSFTPPTFLLLGRFALEKGFPIAIRAFALLKTKAKLLIAGSGEDEGALIQLVTSLGLSHSVQFVGEVAQTEVASLMNQATIVLVPSYFETFGLVALEAMQMERPVIASRVGGVPEVVLDQETGLLVPPHDPVALSQAMQELINHPQRAIEMGLRGRKRALEKFTLRQTMDPYENLILG